MLNARRAQEVELNYQDAIWGLTPRPKSLEPLSRQAKGVSSTTKMRLFIIAQATIKPLAIWHNNPDCLFRQLGLAVKQNQDEAEDQSVEGPPSASNLDKGGNNDAATLDFEDLLE